MANSLNGDAATIRELQEQIKILRHINDENTDLLKVYDRDTLTGALTKEAFFRETQKLLDKYQDDTFLFFRFDIDKFQTINALFGYDEGDRLLQYCANIMMKMSETNNVSTLGRVDADIFCCCIKTDGKSNYTYLSKDIEVFLEGFRDDYRFNVSIGIYYAHGNEEKLRDIYAKTTLAARKCKDTADTYFFIYDEATDAELTKQQIISSEMHKALKQKEFIVFFQPKVDLKTRKLAGAEALIRWHHPQKGILPPSDFLPVFYKTKFITQLDFYVFESVCEMLKEWEAQGLHLVPISINLTHLSMQDSDLPKKLLAIMKKHNIDSKYIHLEITEGSHAADMESSIECARELSNKGFHLEMDDFGTGVSSLTMLHELPVKTLKLDLRFIKSYSETKSNAGIINFIVALARQMQLDLVAEGIETENEHEFLKNIGCGIGQGYLFSKPVPPNDFKKILIEWEKNEVHAESEPQESLIDMNDIWIPDSKFNVLFNMIAGAAAIYEFTNDFSNVKVLKLNSEYLQAMEVERTGKNYNFNDLTQLFLPEDVVEMQRKLALSIQERKPFTLLLRRANIPGRTSYKWLKINARILLETKSTTLFFATLEDVTSQQEHVNYLELEAKIHQDYKHQLSIYQEAETNGLATFRIQDGELVLLYANDIFLHLHGCTREYALSHADTVLIETVHPEDKENVLKALSSLVEKKQHNFRWTMRTLSLTGGESTTLVNGAVTYSDEGVIANIVVRELKDAEMVSRQL